ncbi:hypothetical protein DL96DRAFT_1286750 [Flagelloscypha sp. PMI_526]|nr:hypothetical protein DL96DRAFT_1286750 [Flagelloscypha sp. PMI_526]
MSASLPNELLDAIFTFFRREPELLKVCSLVDRRCAMLCQARFFAHLHLHISLDEKNYIQRFAKLLETSPHIANLVTSVYLGRDALWDWRQQPQEQEEPDQIILHSSEEEHEVLWDARQPHEREADDFSDDSSSSFEEGGRERERKGTDSDLAGLGFSFGESATPESSGSAHPEPSQCDNANILGAVPGSCLSSDTSILDDEKEHPQGTSSNILIPDPIQPPLTSPPLPLLAQVLLALPRVRSMGLRRPYGKSTWAGFSWQEIDPEVLRVLYTHIFPQLVTLKLHDLEDVPLHKTLLLCPSLRVLSLRGVAWSAEDPLEGQLSALAISQEQNVCSMRDLSFNSYSYDSISALTNFLKSKNVHIDSLSFGPSCPNDNVFTCQAVLLEAFSSNLTQLSLGKKLFANFSLPASPEHYFLHRMPVLQTLTLTIELVWDMIEHTFGGINSGFKSFMVFVIDYLLSTTGPHPLSTIFLEVRILKGGAIQNQTSDVWKSLDETLAHNEQLKALSQVAFIVVKEMSDMSEEVCEIAVRDMSKWARGVLPICAGRQLVKTGFK